MPIFELSKRHIMKIKFYTRENYKSQKIYVRMWSKDFDESTTTGFAIAKNDFSNKYQKVKEKSTNESTIINKSLSKLRNTLENVYNIEIANENNFYKGWLKFQTNIFFNRVTEDNNYKKYLLDFVKHYIETEIRNKKTGDLLTQGTQNKRKSVYNTLIDFYKITNQKEVLLKSIDYNFYKEFINYCLNDKGYTNNTTGSKVKFLKECLTDANKRGFCNVDLSVFKTMTNKTTDIYLTDAEINKLFALDLKENLKLYNARNLFIIGCRTGLRVSDFMRLNSSNILDDKIIIKTQKTGVKVVIAMHQQIKYTLKRNNGVLPRKISPQKFNEYIKELCELANISQLVEGGKMNEKTNRKELGVFKKYELVTSHTCRRSFATNLYKQGVKPSIIMATTGHTTEKEFFKYLKVTPTEHADHLQTLYDKQEKENPTKAPLRIAK